MNEFWGCREKSVSSIYLFFRNLSVLELKELHMTFIYIRTMNTLQDKHCCVNWLDGGKNGLNRLIGRVFANGLGDLGSIPGHVIPKTLKMLLDSSLLNTQQYKVCIKGKVEQFREKSTAPLQLSVVAIEKGAFWLPSITIANFTYFTCIYVVSYKA